MKALAQLIRRERQARQNPSSGEVLLLVGDDEYNVALADGRIAGAAGVIRIHLVDPPDHLPDPVAPPRRSADYPRE